MKFGLDSNYTCSRDETGLGDHSTLSVPGNDLGNLDSKLQSNPGHFVQICSKSQHEEPSFANKVEGAEPEPKRPRLLSFGDAGQALLNAFPTRLHVSAKNTISSEDEEPRLPEDKKSSESILPNASPAVMAVKVLSAEELKNQSPPVDESQAPIVNPVSDINPSGSGQHGDGNLSQVSLSNPKMFIQPGIQDLSQLTKNGKCVVTHFSVGHCDFGSITFLGDIDVFGANIDEIVEIKKGGVTIYPNPEVPKPEYGQGFNRPTLITLFEMWPTDTLTQQELKDPTNLIVSQYGEVLKQACKKFDGTFVSYNPETGKWTFLINDEEKQ